MVPLVKRHSPRYSAALRHGDVEIARHRAPVRSEIVEDELAAVGADVLHRGDDERRAGARRSRRAGQARKCLAAVRKRLDDHPPVGHLDRYRAAPRGAAARSTSTDTSTRLATSQGGSLGNMPSMRRSSTTNRPLPDVNAEPADRHLALEPLAALDFRRAPSAPDRDRSSASTPRRRRRSRLS